MHGRPARKVLLRLSAGMQLYGIDQHPAVTSCYVPHWAWQGALWWLARRQEIGDDKPVPNGVNLGLGEQIDVMDAQGGRRS